MLARIALTGEYNRRMVALVLLLHGVDVMKRAIVSIVIVLAIGVGSIAGIPMVLLANSQVAQAGPNP